MSSQGKTAARGRSGTRRRSSQPELPLSTGQSLRQDLLLLLLSGVVLYFTLAVYAPDFVRPAGPQIRGSLYSSLGLGMWLLPMTAIITPFLLGLPGHRKLLLRILNWSWALALLASLTGGLWTDRGWGGILGDSCAALGYQYLGGFYPVVVGLLGLLAMLRLGGRRLIFPLARGAWQVAKATGGAAVRLTEAAAVTANEVAQRARDAKSERELRRQAVIAAELEAADADEGSSALIRDSDLAPAAPEQPVTPSAVKRRRKAGLEVLALEAQSAADETDFAAALEGAVSVETAAAVTEGSPEQSWLPPDGLEQIEGGKDASIELDGGAAAAASRILSGHSMTAAADQQLYLFASTQAGFELPPLELLRDAPHTAGEEAHLSQRSAIIEATLRSFNIDAQCINAVVGPRVTRYELSIGPGINVSKIHALSDNLALELAVKAVRIEAPIPGKRAVGIEVPNAAPQLVTLKSILSEPLMQRSNHPLTVAIGRDIAGNPVIANLAKMPHLLVAGSTGSGKSVCLNTLIVSLLMRNAPDTLRLIMIDPKRVELTGYEGIPHLACPVVCDVNQAQNALKWVVAEMDRRYRVLQARRARNIAAFNEQAEAHERLPFIVVILDELADLMMLAGQTVEKLIARITQLSRAVGIHMVIATQRPDVKVITGTIKANVPSRIAFAVVSNVDSRTILDGAGAEKLLGGGDMLFNPIGENVPLRVQGCFLADDEIDRVVQHTQDQAAARLDESILSFGAREDGTPGAVHDVPTLELDGSLSSDYMADNTDRDALFNEARGIVLDTGKASTSYLQRRLKIGYNRAARIMEELQDAGIVSEPDVRGDRKVL